METEDVGKKFIGTYHSVGLLGRKGLRFEVPGNRGTVFRFQPCIEFSMYMCLYG